MVGKDLGIFKYHLKKSFKSMIRLIVDSGGDSHNTLFVIIDSNPWHIELADTYHLYDFFEITDEEFKRLNLRDDQVIKYSAILLVKYWIDRINTMQKGEKKFIPFDISDQYIGGFLIEKIRNDFKIKLVWTDKTPGYWVSKSTVDLELNEDDFKNSKESEWLISDEGLLIGLNWSLKELSN